MESGGCRAVLRGIPMFTPCSGDAHILVDLWRALAVRALTVITKDLFGHETMAGLEGGRGRTWNAACISVLGAIRKYTTAGGSEQRKCIVSLFWLQKFHIRVSAGPRSAEALGEDASLPLPASGRCQQSLAGSCFPPTPPLLSHGLAPLSVSVSTFPSSYKKSHFGL